MAIRRTSRALQSCPFAINQGWTLVILVERLECLNLVERILRTCRIVFVACPAALKPHVVEFFRRPGITFYDDYVFWGGGEEALAKAHDVCSASTELASGFRVNIVRPDTSDERVREIQEALTNANINPVPGYFLRGDSERARCIYLTDPYGELVGTITAIPLWRGSEHGRTALITGRVILPRWRGARLSRVLTSSSILDVNRHFGCTYFLANNYGSDQRANHTTFFDTQTRDLVRIGMYVGSEALTGLPTI
jgi:hypothetical protein